MASNSIGSIFKMTTWGESHGPAIGVVIDGCPAGITLTDAQINEKLAQRAPGTNPYTSPRKESDVAQVLSGLFEGKTTGAPISIMIKNHDADSSKYEAIKKIYRPGHANYTYLEKYGAFDYRGGGRSSARETAARVAAGAVATALLNHFGIKVLAYIQQIGPIKADCHGEIETLLQQRNNSLVNCPDDNASKAMVDALEEVKAIGDSLGGVVECQVQQCPVGLGDPVYEKLEAKLAHAMLSIPATKGFEIGEGFAASTMRGSEHNDAFMVEDNKTQLKTNHAGGTLGGISNGEPICFRVAFKPTSSIKPKQQSVSTDGQATEFVLPEGSRHDPCVTIRAVPVVEAMTALVIADTLLLNRCVKIEES